MRRRATNTVRVLDKCARCGFKPDLYDVARVHAHLGGRPHELVVCRECTTRYATLPTPMEQSALAVDLTIAVECMDFTDRWHTDPARVQRTAAHFLGGEQFALARAAALEERAQLQRANAERWQPDRSSVDRDYCRECGAYIGEHSLLERHEVHRELCAECGDEMSDFPEDELVS
jgi:hypothetical protein